MDDTATPLLVAERDERAREFLVDNLTADGFDAHGAGGSGEARVKLAHFEPELLVLGELEQPHAHLELLRGVRARGAAWLPVVVVASERTELAELRAFRAGCDDYLARPFAYPVLLARIGALLRRAKGGFIPRLRVGALEIDVAQRQASVAGEPLALTPLEFDLLAHLAAEPTRVHGKQELLRTVWGYRSEGRTRTVEAHACRLRRKLAVAGAPHLVVTVRGVGYRLSTGPVAVAAERELTAAGNGREA